ncbi:MAG: ATP-binding cassette domain-containing protein [Myxococcales bacterium]|nr:ATP-binding cassette domain-containing protein [Myxococcales bacterium]
MARLVVRGLEKRYEARGGGDGVAKALKAFDLDVGDGELVVLVGPSGCGKSTALRLIAGLEEPTAGSVELDGRPLANVPPRERDVAMVFQGYALYPHMTVREIAAFPLEMRGIKKAERLLRVEEIASLVGLSDKLDRLPGELSGGERQRVAMARAMVRSPKLFLFDEPLSNLDAKLRAELRVELVRLVKRLGATAIYVTHDQAEAMTMADRMAVLRAGELLQIGAPREIYETPRNRFIAGFIGTPPMNLCDITIADGVAMAGALRAPLPRLAAVPVALGVRSEHLRLLGRESGSDDDRMGKRDLDAAAASQGHEAIVRFHASVVAVEPFGAESFVHLDAGGTRMTARVPGFGGPKLAAQVEVSVERARLHYFAADGERIGAGVAADGGDPPKVESAR